MILDNLLLVSTAQAITSSADSTNVWDFSQARDMGVGSGLPLKLLVLANAALTSTNSATLTIELQVSTDNSTYNTVDRSPAYAASVLTANTKLWEVDLARLKQSGITLGRYAKLRYTVGTGVFSTGTITACIVPNRDDGPSYPSGFTVAN